MSYSSSSSMSRIYTPTTKNVAANTNTNRAVDEFIPSTLPKKRPLDIHMVAASTTIIVMRTTGLRLLMAFLILFISLCFCVMRPGRSLGAVSLSHGIFEHEIIHTNRNFISVHEGNDAPHNYRCHLSICGILAHIVKIVSVNNPTLTAV